MTTPHLNCRIFVGLMLLAVTGSGPNAEAARQNVNLMPNPGAEEVKNGRPAAGFGMYRGAGKMSLTTSTESPHSGKSAVRLTFEDWHQAEGKPPQLSGFLLIGGSTGYKPNGALPAPPEAFACAYRFWTRGDVGRARMQVWCWDKDQARSVFQVEPSTIELTDDWRLHQGRFPLPTGTKHFTLGVGITGKKDQEIAKLGWLEVDDVAITPIVFPDGELRSVWWGRLEAKQKDEGIKEIDECLKRFKSMGLNTVFVGIPSLYIATLANMEQADHLQAAWDSFGEILKRAHDVGVQVHAWYSPWLGKQKSRAIELRLHPEWACVDAEGKASGRGVCLARSEVRTFELDLLRTLVKRYPDLDGIHLEEPGYPWGDHCYCDHCKQTFRELFGLELTPGSHAAARHNWAAFCSSDFTARLREMLSREYPRVILSANGSRGRNPDWYIGRDWTTWARRGYLDFYVPQIYTESPEGFRKSLRETQSQIRPWCEVIPGMAVTWSGIYPRHNNPRTVQAEIKAARKEGAPGFVFFEARHITDEETEAIRTAIKKQF